MIKDLKDLMTSVDVLNTLHGGLSEPFISFREDTEGREIRVRVPGINREAMQVVINENELTVYYLIPIHSTDKLIYMPRVVYNLQIPTTIEASAIEAAYERAELVVQLPFNTRSTGYRKIEIGEK